MASRTDDNCRQVETLGGIAEMGALRSRASNRKSGVGPVHNVTVVHGTDSKPLELQVRLTMHCWGWGLGEGRACRCYVCKP
jgi:hypothetical protein